MNSLPLPEDGNFKASMVAHMVTLISEHFKVLGFVVKLVSVFMVYNVSRAQVEELSNDRACYSAAIAVHN